MASEWVNTHSTALTIGLTGYAFLAYISFTVASTATQKKCEVRRVEMLVKHEAVMRLQREKHEAVMAVMRLQREKHEAVTRVLREKTAAATSEAAKQESEAAVFRVLTGAEHHGAVENTQ